jgi:hypothetical protein
VYVVPFCDGPERPQWLYRTSFATVDRCPK